MSETATEENLSKNDPFGSFEAEAEALRDAVKKATDQWQKDHPKAKVSLPKAAPKAAPKPNITGNFTITVGRLLRRDVFVFLTQHGMKYTEFPGFIDSKVIVEVKSRRQHNLLVALLKHYDSE